MFIYKSLSIKYFSKYVRTIFVLFDFFILNSSYLLSIIIRFGNLERLPITEVKTILLLSNLLWLALVYFKDAYKFFRMERIESILKRTISLIFLHAAIISTVVIILKFDDISRLRMFYFYLLFFTLVLIFRIVFLKILKRLRSKGYNFRKVAIVGAGENGTKIAQILSADLSLGYMIIGFFDNDNSNESLANYPILGQIKDIDDFVLNHQIDELYVTLNNNQIADIRRLISFCEQRMIRIKFVPEFSQYTKARKVKIDFYFNVPILMLRKEPLQNLTNRVIKRVFDIFFTLFVIMFVLSWLIPLLSLIIYFSSKGPVFYKQIRSGEDNKPFVCFKFRSMTMTQEDHFVQATKNDPRVTKIGRLLRKTNLDELPQFFNVLFGQMSVIGPRPHPLKLDEQYHDMIENYLVRHFAKPGITGWAQVNGYRGETRELIDMQKRVEYDIWYIENWSFLLDLKIIWLTVWNMVRGEKNAY